MDITASSFDYSDLTTEDLNREWMFRARVPDHLDYFEAWRRDSERAREELGGHLDLRYGPHPKETLDLFLPEGATEAPLLIFSHGGYWQAMSKEFSSFIAPEYVKRGVAVAILGHPLCPEVSVSDIVEANGRAVKFLAAGLADPEFTPTRIVMSGHSAGGQVSAFFAMQDWPRFDLEQDTVYAAVAISPILDLEAIVPTPINEKLGLTVEEARAVSPIRFTPAPGAPLIPLAFVTGGDESPLLLRQQAEFAEFWRDAGGEVICLAPEGRHHFDVVQTLARPGEPLFEITWELLTRATGRFFATHPRDGTPQPRTL